MSTRTTRSTRSLVTEPLISLPEPPESQKISRLVNKTPGSEYVTNVANPDCESDSDGLKGEVFAQFVYNQLKHPDASYSGPPKIFIMMGPPGAGKSTIKRQFDIKNYVNIDLDEIKKLLIKCFPNDKSIFGFGVIHQLKRFAKYLLETAIRENMNILFDTTGRMKDVVTNVINTTNSANYQQYIIIISTSRDNCLQRAEMRNRIETDREPMTPEMINGAYDSFIDTSKDKGTLSYYLLSNPELFSHVTEIYIYDNNGPSPQLLFKKVGENVETVVDYSNFYNMNIISSPPYFVMKGRRGGRRTKRRKNNKRKRTRKHY